MRIPCSSRTLLAVVLSTTTACASTEPSPPCTMIGATSGIEISRELVPPKPGEAKICVNSTCHSGKLQGSHISFENPIDVNEATITLEITSEGNTTYDEKTTVKPTEVFLNGPNCGGQPVFRLTADRTGLHPTPLSLRPAKAEASRQRPTEPEPQATHPDRHREPPRSRASTDWQQ